MFISIIPEAFPIELMPPYAEKVLSNNLTLFSLRLPALGCTTIIVIVSDFVTGFQVILIKTQKTLHLFNVFFLT